MAKNTNKRIAVGAAWMVGLRQMDRLIGLVSISILARLLLPEDFGLVVYATTLIALVEIFFQFGFETVLIRDQNAGSESYDTAWTLELIFGFILAIILVISAVPAATYFEEPKVEEVLYFMAVIPILKGFENIGVVDFQKKMEFNREFKFKFSVRVISTAITIAIAYFLRSHWALVYGMIINSFLASILSYIMSDYRPRLCLSRFRRVFGFSKWLLLQNILNGVLDRLSVLIIGRFYGTRTVAFYNMSDELSDLAAGEIAAPIRRALLPGVMEIAGDKKKIVETVISTVGVIAFIGLPTSIGIGVTAPLTIPLLLGDNWLETIPVLQILAINAAGMALYSNSHVIYYALDKPQFAPLITLMRLLLITPSMLAFVPDHGLIGAAWAWTVSNFVVTIAEYFILRSIIGISIKSVIRVVWRSLFSVAVMAMTTLFFMQIMENSLIKIPIGAELILIIGVGVISYASMIYFLWLISGKPAGAESYIINSINKKIVFRWKK